MKEVLFVDCCIRKERSRTRKVAQALLDALDPKEFHVTTLDPEAEGMRPLTGAFFEAREALLAKGELGHPRFRYAHQLAQADVVVMAAPFWDLSFPALLKIYIENVSVDGITFWCDAAGMHGGCKASRFLFVTTRGGAYGDSALEQGRPYLAALKDFFGFGSFETIAAEGLDLEGADPEALVEEACRRAREIAGTL